MKPYLGHALALALLALSLTTAPAWAQTGNAKHKLVVQVSDDNPKTWHQALNNARNVQQELGKGNVDIQMIVYGNGIGMLKLESEVGDRVKQATDDGVRVVACENTMRAYNLTREDMLPYAGYVKAGIVEIMTKQQQGYAYVRP